MASPATAGDPPQPKLIYHENSNLCAHSKWRIYIKSLKSSTRSDAKRSGDGTITAEFDCKNIDCKATRNVYVKQKGKSMVSTWDMLEAIVAIDELFATEHEKCILQYSSATFGYMALTVGGKKRKLDDEKTMKLASLTADYSKFSTFITIYFVPFFINYKND